MKKSIGAGKRRGTREDARIAVIVYLQTIDLDEIIDQLGEESLEAMDLQELKKRLALLDSFER